MKYILRSFDGRQSLPQTFTSLAAAKRAAKRIFGWQRLYATPWYPMADMTSDGEDEIYMAAWDQERHHDTPPDLTPRRVVLEALED